MRTLVLVAALLAPGWSLGEARSALVHGHFVVTDTSQPDRPEYELVFTRRTATSLRASGRRFVLAGRVRDAFTDADIPVRFTFVPPGRITRFRGPAADTSQPAFPIRATFYYAWYPEAWSHQAVYPHTKFRPTLDYYSASDAGVVRAHTEAMRYARLQAGIYSWWGAGGFPPTDARFWRYLAAARTTPFRWALYYEREGYFDLSVEEIRTDLEYIRDRYASKPAYLKVDGRFVVFVYGSGHNSCDSTARRWRAANTVGAYLVLKAFDGHLSCSDQPDAWHQYSAALAQYSLPRHSFMVAPGFDENAEPAPRLARDLTRWREDVAAMVASGAPWQLVLTFNEWPEGTSVESAREWASPSGHGAYLDVLHEFLP
jgi:hypothetical protein